MIRLPSFFKRETHSDDLESGSVGRRTIKRAVPRAFQRAVESEELALTEDPEQQRARHRLVGATVLVLIAVVGLPRILDNKPKAVNNDIAVNIVTSLPTPSADPKPEEKPKSALKHEASIEVPKAAPPEVKVETKVETKPVVSGVGKASAIGLSAGEEVVAIAPGSNSKANTDGSVKAADGAIPKNAMRYTIPVGSFATDDGIKTVTAKLKEFRIPYTIKTKTKSDGTKLVGFIAGPFPDRDAAEAAEKKIKASLNPTAKIIENGKQ